MKHFTALYDELDSTTRLSEKQAALERYFRSAAARDAAWAVAFLTGRRPRRAVSSRLLREWASAESCAPMWLVDECLEVVGDLSETLALLLPDEGTAGGPPLHVIAEERIAGLQRLDEDAKQCHVKQTWRELGPRQRFVYHKLLSGSFRVGVQRATVVRALAAIAGIDPAVMDHRLLGRWSPTTEWFERLLGASGDADEPARPFPFFLAPALVGDAAMLGPIEAWQAEWKWDGVRAQMLHRAGAVLLWTRGETMAGESFPELMDAARALPIGTVLDGEVLAWDAGSTRPLPFALLQRRLNRVVVEPLLFHDVPAVFMAYDVLEEGGRDLRGLALRERRSRLESIVRRAGVPTLLVSELIEAESWPDLASRRAASWTMGVEGLMLKRKDSAYGAGRTRGDWWKWKVDPFVIDAVLIAAQRGSGRRAGLLTDYTFGVWSGSELVTVAKAYSGLSDDEIREVDRVLRASTIARRGPVRVVKPELVFELAFEGIQESSRHKGGVALRFPRMHRWRRDKRAEQADRIEVLHAMLAGRSGGNGA